jgi:hypothetical protein
VDAAVPFVDLAQGGFLPTCGRGDPTAADELCGAPGAEDVSGAAVRADKGGTVILHAHRLSPILVAIRRIRRSGVRCDDSAVLVQVRAFGSMVEGLLGRQATGGRELPRVLTTGHPGCATWVVATESMPTPSIMEAKPAIGGALTADEDDDDSEAWLAGDQLDYTYGYEEGVKCHWMLQCPYNQTVKVRFDIVNLGAEARLAAYDGHREEPGMPNLLAFFQNFAGDRSPTATMNAEDGDLEVRATSVTGGASSREVISAGSELYILFSSEPPEQGLGRDSGAPSADQRWAPPVRPRRLITVAVPLSQASRTRHSSRATRASGSTTPARPRRSSCWCAQPPLWSQFYGRRSLSFGMLPRTRREAHERDLCPAAALGARDRDDGDVHAAGLDAAGLHSHHPRPPANLLRRTDGLPLEGAAPRAHRRRGGRPWLQVERHRRRG